ncbi:protein phosphatase PTC7 homolog fig [Drosophila grimshawi]|uniref:Protein phosphatase PTC7 homolog fig n=1 Tax=Drosophila grimshawi TaxID=7222 RepID=PTC71_DROGR|nr:protein phosphatase PTC7 homolog fig [Drosophila grimshawi]B4JYN1.1 RecName: Full=Protein phosphatase PTC7 homolog fig; AltName: Full=Fos intronic gene protein [Drosophila grimshawi]EDV90793.1 GH13984 [Drosophila grimshawi]
MFFKVCQLGKGRCCQVLLNYASCQRCQLSSYKGTPRLIKAVQGSSKDQQLAGQVQRFGEDSWFVHSAPKSETMGVADGVGGWRQMGIDSGVFAKQLMTNCSKLSEQADYDGRNPRQLLIDGYHRLKEHATNVWGSSTACLVSLHRSDCTLHSANLGDSGFLVLRHGKVLHRSDEQLHVFNTPYQLSVPPTSQMHKVLSDQPEEAICTQLGLQQGDLVLVATDGLFDNVVESELVQQLQQLHGETRVEKVQLAANRLVDLAKRLSLRTDYQSPFALRAKANNMNYGAGGKPDDITVILASVEVSQRSN